MNEPIGNLAKYSWLGYYSLFELEAKSVSEPFLVPTYIVFGIRITRQLGFLSNMKLLSGLVHLFKYRKWKKKIKD